MAAHDEDGGEDRDIHDDESAGGRPLEDCFTIWFKRQQSRREHDDGGDKHPTTSDYEENPRATNGSEEPAKRPHGAIMPPLTAIVNPQPTTVVKVYHCGNFLGIFIEGGGWWCRKCHRLITATPTKSVGD